MLKTISTLIAHGSAGQLGGSSGPTGLCLILVDALMHLQHHPGWSRMALARTRLSSTCLLSSNRLAQSYSQVQESACKYTRPIEIWTWNWPTVVFAMFCWPKQITNPKDQARSKEWGNRFYLLMGIAAKPYCENMDTGKGRDVWSFL